MYGTGLYVTTGEDRNEVNPLTSCQKNIHVASPIGAHMVKIPTGFHHMRMNQNSLPHIAIGT